MTDVFDLSGRVAIVTGAAGLLGTEHCICLARAGATVVAVDIDGEACRALCDRIAVDFGGKAVSVEANITNREDLIGLCEQLSHGFGRIDILVNNAAMDDKVTGEKNKVDASRFERFPLDVWQRVLNVNVTGTFLCCQVFGAYMAERAQLNLRVIETLKQRFPECPIGYSGHETGLAPTIAAAAVGANFVERHITLDRAMWGSDQAASVELVGLMRLVESIRDVERALGSGQKVVYEEETAAKKKLRRSEVSPIAAQN